MSAFTPTFRKSAFTLIELLSAIAIIGVLASLAMVGVSSARNSARSSACACNLRQIQLASMAYASDHRGGYAPIRKNGTVSAASGVVYWYDNTEFLPYLVKSSSSGKIADILCCPLAVEAGNAIERSYGANVTGFTGNLTVVGYVRQILAAQVARPSQTMAFGDGLDWQLLADGATNYTGQETYAIHAAAYRHRSLANVVYFDGHTAALPQSVFTDPNMRIWNILN